MQSADQRHWVDLPISLDLTGAAYTVQLSLGSEAAPVQLIIDTGSSSLAVLPGRYSADRDRSLNPTSWAQQLSYGQGAWVGPVVCTDLRLDASGHHLADTQLAVIEAESTDFHGADGILGMAYRALDHAHDIVSLLPAPSTQSWPWPFDEQHSAQADFTHQLHAQPKVQLVPAFSALEEHGVVSNRFTLLIRRALKRVDGRDGPHPDNEGRLLLGGGEELAHLHHGEVQTLPVVHDRYYNVQLTALQVDQQSPLPAPPLREAETAAYASNAIIDTGCSFILLEDSLYSGLREGLNRIDARLVERIDAAAAALAQQRGLVDPELSQLPWPTLWLHFDAGDGETARVALDPAHYWQHDALQPGESWFMLLRQLPDWPRQSVLGLPLLCDHFVVFDRQVNELGVVRLARARHPGP
ncbi:MAG: hypothetical protein KDI37_01810 [Xanthomonadales bacterium]|nr:hypothetical protein [Xanthomonadales bacterium]